MPTLAKYKIDLEMTTAKFKRQLTSVNSGLKTVGREALAVGKVIGAIAPAAGVAGLAAMTKQALESQAALYDMSQRLGVTAEGLSRLQYAAEQSGVSTQTLNMGLQRMTRRVSEAANGTGEAVKALDELGVSAASLTKLAPEEQFKVLADAIMSVEDPASRVRLAMKLFDSEGVSLIQTMQGGSKAIEAIGAEADRLGVTIDGKAAAAAKRATDAFTRLGASFTGVANSIGSQFAPEIEAAANWLSEQVPAAVGFARKALLVARKAFIDFTAKVIEARIAWNEFTGDIDEANSLRKTADILNDMSGDISVEIESLKNASGAKAAYTIETDKQRYSLEQFTEAAKAANDAVNTPAKVVELPTAVRMASSQEGNNRFTVTEQAHQEHANNIVAIEQEKNAVILNSAQDLFGSLASATSQFAGEQSGIYKALFAIEKGAAIARSIIAIQTGIAQAAAAPYPANLAAMAQVAGATASIISTISSTQFGGARASGGNVDAGKSYWVGERGPELFMPQSSGTVVPNNQAMQAPQVNVRLVNIEGSDGYENWASSSGGEQVFINHLQRNKRLIRSLVA